MFVHLTLGPQCEHRGHLCKRSRALTCPAPACLEPPLAEHVAFLEGKKLNEGSSVPLPKLGLWLATKPQRAAAADRAR